MSVDTRVFRRDLSDYQAVGHDGVELLLLPPLIEHATSVNVDLRKFLFFRNLRAEIELENGLVLGRREL